MRLLGAPARVRKRHGVNNAHIYLHRLTKWQNRFGICTLPFSTFLLILTNLSRRFALRLRLWSLGLDPGLDVECQTLIVCINSMGDISRFRE